MSKHFDLSGRVAVITGGARGIGLAAAQRMADAGADIAIVDRDRDATAAAVADIEARGRRALGCHPIWPRASRGATAACWPSAHRAPTA